MILDYVEQLNRESFCLILPCNLPYFLGSKHFEAKNEKWLIIE